MPGSEIYFREPTVWEQYRAQILTVCAVILLQSALIFWLLYQRGRRRSEARVHELSGRALNAQAEERNEDIPRG